MGVQISTSVSIIDSLFGFQAVSLTAFDTASVPTIAAGSKVEIAGGFFSFTSDESINATSWTAISTGDTAYITLTPAGTAGTQTVTAEWTDTAPTWSDSKQAYYASAGSNIRVIGGCLKDGTSGTEYSHKWLYKHKNPFRRYAAGGATENAIFDQLTDWIPTDNDFLKCQGQLNDGGTKYVIIGMFKTSTYIRFIYIDTGGASGFKVITDGSAGTITYIDITSDFIEF